MFGLEAQASYSVLVKLVPAQCSSTWNIGASLFAFLFIFYFPTVAFLVCIFFGLLRTVLTTGIPNGGIQSSQQIYGFKRNVLKWAFRSHLS